ncbi:TIGR00304 family membrane protein, partial [Aeropyrum camini]
AGFLLIFLGVVLVFLGVFASAVQGGGRVEGGGVVVIGPIPIVFGSSEKMFLISAAIGLLFMILAIALALLARRGI